MKEAGGFQFKIRSDTSKFGMNRACICHFNEKVPSGFAKYSAHKKNERCNEYLNLAFEELGK